MRLQMFGELKDSNSEKKLVNSRPLPHTIDQRVQHHDLIHGRTSNDWWTDCVGVQIRDTHTRMIIYNGQFIERQ